MTIGDLVAVMWRLTPDGRPVKPAYRDGELVWLEYVDNGDWQLLEEPPDPDRMGRPQVATTEDGRELRWLHATVSYFAQGGSNPDPLDSAEPGKIRHLKIPMSSRLGVPYTDEFLVANIEAAVREGAQDVRADIEARHGALRDELGRAELVREGMLQSEQERPNLDAHDQRRRVAASLSVIDCGCDDG